MPKLTAEFVQAALDHHVWDLGNEILYRLCADYPGHAADDVIIAKTWLIGRAYAAAVERRRDRGEFSGDAFYEKGVAPGIRQANVDTWMQKLRDDISGSKILSLTVHKHFSDLLNDITGLKKRSFASKYLHFHFPTKFFIYDILVRPVVSSSCSGVIPDREHWKSLRAPKLI